MPYGIIFIVTVYPKKKKSIETLRERERERERLFSAYLFEGTEGEEKGATHTNLFLW